MKVHLIIYGVFDRRTDHYVKVGSTSRSLHLRARGYRTYKWYDSSRYEHRILWEGDVPNDEDLHFIRAAKEVSWIGQMKTWWDQGGLNQMNPVLYALRNPTYFSELCAIGGRTSKGGLKGGPRCKELHPNQYSEMGKKGGRKGGKIGGRRVHELHPNQTADIGRKYGSIGGRMTNEMSNGRKGNGGRKAAGKGAHTRFHVRRGITKASCRWCSLWDVMRIGGVNDEDFDRHSEL